jgi:hypothetical protein
MSIKDMVKDGKKATFAYYKQNELWYITEDGFEFPVPVDDTGDGVFHAVERAMLLMRYIRKHLQCIESGKQEQQNLV